SCMSSVGRRHDDAQPWRRSRWRSSPTGPSLRSFAATLAGTPKCPERGARRLLFLTELLHVAVDVAAAVLLRELLQEVVLDRQRGAFSELDRMDLRPSVVLSFDPVEVAGTQHRFAGVREKEHHVGIPEEAVLERFVVLRSQVGMNTADELPGQG